MFNHNREVLHLYSTITSDDNLSHQLTQELNANWSQAATADNNVAETISEILDAMYYGEVSKLAPSALDLLATTIHVVMANANP